VPTVHRAIQRRAPGLLLNASFDFLSADQYADLCYAIEAEINRAQQPSVGALELER
jgi:hypothetical protein